MVRAISGGSYSYQAETGMSSLKMNPQIEKSLRRLQQLGLKVDIIEQGPDWVIVICEGRSVIEAMKRVIDRNIGYPKHLVMYDEELDTILVHFWKGDMPAPLKEKVYSMWGKR